MKRLLTVFLAVTLALPCAACAGRKEPVLLATPPSASRRAEPSPGPEPSAAPDAAAQPPGDLLAPAGTDLPQGSPAPAAGVEGKEAPDDGAQQNPAQAAASPVDMDLTAFSSTMVYAEIFNMTTTPNDYVGKSIRIRGIFSTHQDPDTQKVYCGVIVQDATACCSQGFEVEMPPQSRYPDDYPTDRSEVTIVGTIQVDRALEEYGILSLRLEDVCFE